MAKYIVLIGWLDSLTPLKYSFLRCVDAALYILRNVLFGGAGLLPMSAYVRSSHIARKKQYAAQQKQSD